WNALRAATAILAILIAAPAQVSPERTPPLTPPKIQSLPFKIGETLTYDVSFSRLIFSGTIGELKLSVSNPSEPMKTPMLELKAEAVSKGFFPALFGVKVRDRYITLVDANDFGIHSSTKLLEEGKVRREQKSIIDREAGRVTFIDRDLATEKSEPRTKEKPSPSWIQDVLSAIYYVRTQPLKEGEVIPIPISDGAETYNIEVIAGKREELKVGSAKIRAIQVNAKVFDGRYLKRSGEMLVWIADDERRVPVRARVKTSGYTINVELRR
ncbi:MAG TPA: DUF3108 domain-containing protein, partial [Blastocatellia bacterium]|nr:DUF3108 domain-containing protein [Blastocatellia bacterium]